MGKGTQSEHQQVPWGKPSAWQHPLPRNRFGCTRAVQCVCDEQRDMKTQRAKCMKQCMCKL
eukprot:scaffold114319_cov19-Tisochrysis_lutea.AAC.2